MAGYFESRSIQAMVQVPWLAGAAGAGYAGSRGRMLDAELKLLVAAVQMAWLDQAPDDALDHIGYNFALPRFPGELAATYRPRLAAAWVTREYAGTPTGVAASIMAYGVPDVAVYEDWQGHFACSGRRAWYPRFWVILGPDFGQTGIAPLVAPFAGGPNTTGGSTATLAQVRAIVRQILYWKSPSSYPVAVYLQFPGVILGGVNAIAPFTPPASGSPWCKWDIGKLFPASTPFTTGGYYTY